MNPKGNSNGRSTIDENQEKLDHDARAGASCLLAGGLRQERRGQRVPVRKRSVFQRAGGRNGAGNGQDFVLAQLYRRTDENVDGRAARRLRKARSEEHTSELQSRENLVCRLLLEKKKHTQKT